MDYAFCEDTQSNLNGDKRQIAKYIYEEVNSEDNVVSEESVFQSLNEFFKQAKQLKDTKLEAASPNQNLSIHKLYGGNLLVIDDKGKAKVINPGQENQALNFNPAPKTVEDNILLSLTKEELDCMFRVVDWNSISGKHNETNRAYCEFFTSAKDTIALSVTEGGSVEFSAPLRSAKVAIDDLLYNLSKLRTSMSRELLNLSLFIDSQNNVRSNKDSNENEVLKNLEVNQKTENTVHDINSVMNVLYKLDEQLWCKAAFKTKAKDILSLFTAVSRPNSAIERLSTFVGEKEYLHSLSNYGYIFREDNILQNVFDDSHIKKISEDCHDAINDSLLVQNSINAPLENSLNYLPPSNLKHKKLIISPNSDFLFKFTEKGLCKVYTAGLSLVEVGSINFNFNTESETSASSDNKKYISQLINFEVSNGKAKQSFSASNPMNIKKEALTLQKTGEVINKYKPKKGPKSVSKKSPNKCIKYDEDEDVYDIGGLFDDDSEGFESDAEKAPTAPESKHEETKTPQKAGIDPAKLIKHLGYSALVNVDYLKQERQNCISIVYEKEGEIILDSRIMHIQLKPSYLKWFDFNSTR